MRNTCISLLVALAVAAPALAQGDPEEGFVTLFDGRSLDGWEAADGFVVDDGTLLTRGAKAGDLYTTAEYGNVILRLDYMLSPVGNSGVFVRTELGRHAETGFEVQLLAPWTPYRDDLHCTGSLYGHVPVTTRPDESTGVWHSMEIVLDRDTVIVSVDGKMATWARTEWVDGLRDKSLRGRIGFQGNHSDPEQWVRFRNIRIRDLDADVDYTLRGFQRTDPQIRRTAHAATLRLGAAAVPDLCQLMAGSDTASSSAARETLFAIVAPGHRAGRHSRVPRDSCARSSGTKSTRRSPPRSRATWAGSAGCWSERPHLTGTAEVTPFVHRRPTGPVSRACAWQEIEARHPSPSQWVRRGLIPLPEKSAQHS